MAECDFIYIRILQLKTEISQHPGTQLLSCALGFTDLHAGFHPAFTACWQTENRHPSSIQGSSPGRYCKTDQIPPVLPPADDLAYQSTIETRAVLQKNGFVPAAAAGGKICPEPAWKSLALFQRGSHLHTAKKKKKKKKKALALVKLLFIYLFISWRRIELRAGYRKAGDIISVFNWRILM